MNAKRTGRTAKLHVVGGARRQSNHSQRERAEASGGIEQPETLEQLKEMQETHPQALSRLERLEGAAANVARSLDKRPRLKGAAYER